MARVLALVSKPRGLAPGQRFRLEQWAPLLASEHGISVDFQEFESPALTALLYKPGHRALKAVLLLRDAVRSRHVVRRAAEYDAVIIYREVSLLGPAIYERLLARNQVPIIYDFDDAIWLPQTGGVNGVFARLHFPGKTAAICGLASAVVVGNRYLADYAQRYSLNVHIVPTTVNLDTSAVQPSLPFERPFTIVWVGSHSSLRHLELVREALERFGRQRKTVLRVVCSQPPAKPFGAVELEFVPWSAEGEAAKLGMSHVGIMPLPDDPFSRGKCGMKALQYMAVGRPVVVSPVGVNAEIVRDRENGLLASTTEEWIRALEALADSRELRERLGKAGRETVEERFSAEVGARAFANVVNDVLGRSANRAPITFILPQ